MKLHSKKWDLPYGLIEDLLYDLRKAKRAIKRMEIVLKHNQRQQKKTQL